MSGPEPADALPPGKRRLKHALRELQARRMIRNNRLTPLQRLFLKLGDNPPPLEYAPFGRVAGLTGAIATVVFVALLWPAFAFDADRPGWVGLVMGLVTGGLFGLAMGVVMQLQHRLQDLTAWSALDTAPDLPEPDEISAAALAYLIERHGSNHH